MTTRDVEHLLVSLGLDYDRVHPITGGWSYWTFEVEQDDHGEYVELSEGEPGWIFRFARKGVVAENLQKEQAVLPVVAPRVDFAVPWFEHAGNWIGQPYVGYRRIPGRSLDHPELTAETSQFLGIAFTQLHGVPTSLVTEACDVEPTVDSWRQRYCVLRDEVRTNISPLLKSNVRDAVERGFERFFREQLETLNDVNLVHCDLGCEHILIGDDGTTVSGLIDFEDASIGDPTIDFVGIFVKYGMETVERVRDGYRRVLDEHFEHRLRFYTWMASCHETLYGLNEGRSDLVERGIEGLRRRLVNAGLI